MGQSKNSFVGNNFDAYSSKIKKIYIQLFNYSFFHAPSEVGNMDMRFIGRKKIIKRLENIINGGYTKTGCYLISGHRGVGKSSFVNKVLDENSAKQNFILFNKNLIVIFLFSMLFIRGYEFFEKDVFILIFTVATTIITLLIFLWVNNLRIHLKKELFENIKLLVNFVLDVFVLRNNYQVTLKLRSFFQTIFLILFSIDLIILKTNNIYFIVWYSENSFLNIIYPGLIILLYLVYQLLGNNKERKKYNFLSVLITDIIVMTLIIYPFFNFFRLFDDFSDLSFCIIYVADIVVFNWYFYKRKKLKQVRDMSFNKIVKEFVKLLFYDTIKNYIVFSSRIFIRLNFGYDDLKEIDVLKLITRSITKQFKSWQSALLKNFGWFLIKFVIIYIVINVFYYSAPFYSLHKQFENNIGLYKFFPSQGNFDYNRIEKSMKIQNLTFFIDELISNGFQRISTFTKSTIMDLLKISIGPEFSNRLIRNKQFYNIYIIPRTLDYFFIIYVFFAILLMRYVLKFKILGIVSSRYIINRLNSLNEQINAQITKEKYNELNISPTKNTFLGFLYKNRRIQNFPVADEREIEKSLIEILDDISNIKRLLTRPEFIIILDELDKLETFTDDEVEKSKEKTRTMLIYYSPEGTRARAQMIMKLLSNLKYFLTTAKAKFIFIAGREMYDASLADVSDRNYFIGSIFHDIIYVPSFYTDDSDSSPSDITSMTEQYVCQFLFPEDWPVKSYTLKEYNKYLIKNISDLNDASYENDLEAQLARNKREKIISILTQFITYLTHVSNGAPKKITKLFEEFVESPNKEIITNYKPFKISNKNNHCLFLAFDYFNQYTLGVINYLSNPIILNISNRYKKHGDKLLISTSFLVDHIFKYHRSAFSWRNIELTPELIDINKSPELRNFITGIVQFLTKTHLQEIITGLHDFKFSKRISHEISFLSKTSESASAAFNFSLDESLALKQYFREYINVIETRYNNNFYKDKKSEYIHSLSFLHIMLGDLHYYDEEIVEAIIEYMDSVQVLRRLSNDEMNVPLAVLLVRNMLKLGVAFEKRKAYDSAYLTYGELTELLIANRNIEIDRFGLAERIDEKEYKLKNILVKKDKNDLKDNIDYDYFASICKRGKEEDEKIECADNPIKNTTNSIKTFLDILTEDLNPLKQKTLFKISTFEGLKLLYQPLLAKLQIIEKSHLDGITLDNIKRTWNEFEFLIKAIKYDEKIILISDFTSKLAEILYYKNADFMNLPKDIKPEDKDQFESDFLYECKVFVINSNKCLNVRRKIKDNNRLSCISCFYYNKSLKNILKIENIESENDIFSKVLRITVTESYSGNGSLNCKMLAKILSDQGDVYLSCVTEIENINSKKVEEILEIKDNLSFDNAELDEFGKSNIYKALIYYKLSSKYYLKASEHKKASFQLIKILYCLRGMFHGLKQELAINLISRIEDYVVRNAIKYIYDSYDNIHLYEIEKMKEVFNNYDINIPGPIFLSKTSVHIDIDEVVLLFAQLKFELLKKPSELTKIYKYNFVSPYSLNESIYNRILNLRFKAFLNYQILEKYFSSKLDKDNVLFELEFIYKVVRFFELEKIYENDKVNFIAGITSEKELIEFIKEVNINKEKITNLGIIEFLEFIIHDSIFCLNEIIKLSNTYGFSFMLNYSYIATVHKDLSTWSQIYFWYLSIISIKNDKNGVSDEFFKKYIKKISETSGNDVNPSLEIIKKQVSEFLLKEFKNGKTHLYLTSSLLPTILSLQNVINSDEENNTDFGISLDANFIEIIKPSLKIDEDMFVREILDYVTKDKSDLSNTENIVNILRRNLSINFIKIANDLKERLNKAKLPHASENINTFKEKLEKLIDIDNMPFINFQYQGTEAIRYYEMAKESHTEGKAYKNLIETMCYNNDDYNDRLYHFSIARERFSINTSIIEDRIEIMKKKHGNSERFHSDNYLVPKYIKKNDKRTQPNE